MAIICVSVGAVLILFGAGLHQSAVQLDNQIHLQGAAAHLQPSLVSIIRSISNSFERIYTWFGLVYLLVGIGLFVALKFWLKRATEKVSEPITLPKQKADPAEPKNKSS